MQHGTSEESHVITPLGPFERDGRIAWQPRFTRLMVTFLRDLADNISIV
jgi:hypothetical protein